MVNWGFVIPGCCRLWIRSVSTWVRNRLSPAQKAPARFSSAIVTCAVFIARTIRSARTGVKMQSKEMECQILAEKLLYLQNELGCHNINFVSPSHFVPQILKTLLMAIPMGLKIPLVYNTSGYDSLETIKALDGIIDIYLPDLRYASDKIAKCYSQAPDYVEHARNAIKEMYRQVGNLINR